jgi:CheY-like chemotaxis protein
VQLLLLDTPPGSPTRADLEETQRAVDRAAALTRQLLAFSRKQVMRPQPVALEALVGGVDTLLRRVIGEDVELVTDVPPGTWPVRVDPGQMEQVLVNLAVNARDAMPRGGKLSITARNGPAGGSPRRGCARRFAARDHVLLSVADTGTGMDEATLARVFEPFFTTRPEGQGTGLGMSTVYGIVRQSDGEICVESSPGRGTAVHVSLPRCDPAEGDERPAAEPAAVVVVGGETILLVEDEPGVRAVVSRLLRRSGYSLLEAASGEEAVELMDGDRLAGVDLVITDVVMPGLTGPELAARLRLARPRLKILYMSGYTDAALQSHGALAPGVDLIEKPFSLEVLAARVRLLLDAA